MALRYGKEIRYSESVLVFGYDFPVNAAERTTFGFGHAFTLRQCGRSLHRQIQNRRRNYAQERAVAREINPLTASVFGAATTATAHMLIRGKCHCGNISLLPHLGA